MKINNLNRFQVNPVNLDIQRSRLGRGYSNTTTFITGDLVPIYIHETLPGETLRLDFSSVIRSLTPAVPVMDNAFVDFYFFFVPNRLCTNSKDDWQKVCGENTSGYWAPSTEADLANTSNTVNINSFTTQTINSVSYKVAPQSLGNYLGLPVLPTSRVVNGTSSVINTLAPRAYISIWNEWFRDENTQAPATFTASYIGLNSASTNSLVKKVNKYHDLFTSSMPSPQKGNSVLLPLGSTAPVITGAAHNKATSNVILAGPSGTALFDASYQGSGLTLGVGRTGTASTGQLAIVGDSESGTAQGGLAGKSGIMPTDVLTGAIPQNFYADLSAATAASVNELRNAVAIQRMLEKDGRSGSRYFECLLGHFGVSNPDLVLQRPEYLAGKRVPLNVMQVLQTSETSDNSPLGSTGAFSNTASHDYMFTKSFGEYGFVMGLACVRTSQSYSQGLPKYMLRTRRFDFYWPSFANIGEQPILKKELYYANNNDNNNAVFGYQEAWADYRYQANKISGYFAPDAGDTLLSAWTYTNKFNSYPTLNSDFMKQPASQFADTLAVSDTPYHFLANFYFDEKLTLPMPLYSIPGLIDHH